VVMNAAKLFHRFTAALGGRRTRDGSMLVFRAR
jgi:hypothetical protein